MLTQEKIVTIKVLKKQGQSIKGIARETGLARNTVRKYLKRDTSTPAYERKVTRSGKLDPFKGYIKSRIAAAHPDWIPASVLFKEMAAQDIFIDMITQTTDSTEGAFDAQEMALNQIYDKTRLNGFGDLLAWQAKLNTDLALFHEVVFDQRSKEVGAAAAGLLATFSSRQGGNSTKAN